MTDASNDIADPVGPAEAAVARSDRPFGRFLGIVALVVALCSAVAVALPHDPYIRYQSFQGTIFARLGWIYDRLVYDKTPIDVLFVGSSRTARGADAAGLEAALDALGQPGLHVANISMPASGLDVRLTKLRLALREHPEIRLVVLGVVEALPRDGHQAFGDLGTAGEVLSAPWIVNRTLPGNLARLPFRQMTLALASQMPGNFGYRTEFDPAVYPGPTPSHRDFSDGTDTQDWREVEAAQRRAPEAHTEALARESARRKRQITPPILPEALAWVEFGVSRTYMRRIADLVRDEGADLAFLFLPFYDGYERPADAVWLEDLAPIWPASFLRDDPALYFDVGHLSQAGIDRATPWIARQIAETLEPAR